MAYLDGTLSQLISDVRMYLDEPSQNQWSDANITTCVNYAYRQSLNYLERVSNTRLTSQANIAFISNTQEYNLPTNCEYVLDVQDNGSKKPILFVPFQERYFYLDGNRGYMPNMRSNNIVAYIRNDKIGICPIPLSDVTDAITITYIPAQSTLSGSADAIQIPKKYHELIVLGAVLRLKASRGEIFPPELQQTLTELWSDYMMDIDSRSEDAPRFRWGLDIGDGRGGFAIHGG